MSGGKRRHSATDHDMNDGRVKVSPDGVAPASSPILSMFEHFRGELDEHHDRRERIIKASRDVTAASKKIIFTLQRSRTLGTPLPPSITKPNQPHYTTITTSLSSILSDLQTLNTHRYHRQISPGCQEWVEAVTFQHYLETATLLTYVEAAALLRSSTRKHNNEGTGEAEEKVESVPLTPEDYLLGVYDMTGELMRFAITTMATTGALPSPPPPSTSQDSIPPPPINSSSTTDRTLLTDLRSLRSALESLHFESSATGPWAREVEKKAEVMRTSVEKVERALYGLVVRGAERPKGWMPDVSSVATGAGTGMGMGSGVEVEG